MDEYTLAITFAVTLSLGGGILGRMGYLKFMYIAKTSGRYTPGTMYALIPIGLMFLTTHILHTMFGSSWFDRAISWILFFGFMGIGVLFLMWRPRWMKPQWLHWLEDNYPYIINTLLEEARQQGRDWLVQVRTQEGLEEWAKRAAAKYGY